jgi:citrate synthase
VGKDTLTITDNRTGKTYEVPIEYGTYPAYGAYIKTSDLRQIQVSDDDFGLLGHDPSFANTSSCKSRITFIDGERGILRHGGYPIEQLAEHSTYLETAYLIIHGELPTRAQLEGWTAEIARHAMVTESVRKFLDGFHCDAHPMGMLIGTVGALSTFYPDAKDIHDRAGRHRQITRLIAQVPTLAGLIYRRNKGLPPAYPDPDLSYTGNFLSMLFKLPEKPYRPNPVIERALEVLFILHADHEQNCSSTAMRVIGSAHTDPYSALVGAAAALYGPLHGGANEQVMRMLAEIGSKDKVPAYLKRVQSGEVLLMGFGHRVYKNYDPRAKIIQKIAHEVFNVTGRNPMLDIALELERIALEDEYFVKRRLYPNVDFYSGIIYQALGFPLEFFPVLFAIPRTSGWLAQWEEMLTDPEQRISRPRQVYTGPDVRDYVPMATRDRPTALSP